MTHTVWLRLTIAALLGSCAYFFPVLSIFLLPVAIILLWSAQYQLLDAADSYQSSIIQNLYAGFWWGALFFGSHFIWLLILLINYAHASYLLSLSLFLLLTIYFALSASIWFCMCLLGARLGMRLVNKRLASMLSFGITIYCYWWFLSNYSLWFCARKEGYPLLSPFIPLASYKYMLVFMGYVGSWFHGEPLVQQAVIPMYETTTTCINNTAITWCRLTPIKQSAHWTGQEYGDAITTQLQALNLKNNNQLTLIVGPESTVPIPLNEYPDIIKRWGYELSNTSYLLIGAYRRTQSPTSNKTKWYQTIYVLHNGVIVDWYDKTHCVPFNEKVPSFFRRFDCMNDLFLKEQESISSSKVQKNVVWQLGERCALVPRICSELFNTGLPNSAKTTDNKPLVIWHVNDSWFVPSVRRLLALYAKWWATWHQVSLLYIAHTDAFLITDSECD